MESWLSEHMVGYLLRQLDSFVDVDGRSLLETTMVIALHELGTNHESYVHVAIVAGGNDWLPGGRFRSFDGRSLNDFYVGVCHKLGLEDVETFGDPSFNSRPLEL